MQTQAASIRARLHIDPVGWHPSSVDLSLLPVVQDAIARDCKLTFVYRRADGDTGVRTVDPYGIVNKQAVWYLVARAPAGMRTYRFSRMQNAVVLAVTFERPANFDLAAHWKTATALLQQKRTQFQATLALAADAAVSIGRWCRASAAPDVQATPSLPDGWTILHVSFESMEEARFLALALGARVHVLAPTTLREQVLEELQTAVRRPMVHAKETASTSRP
jgi:predicted DNA-binding transcriptional regulator YafY